MGKLTTHVLDTALGKPAAGLWIDLYRITGPDERNLVKAIATNTDGRCDEPLLEGGKLVAGVYELRFHAGDYLRGLGVSLPEPPFLDIVPILFGVSDANAHYHVPLLISPYGYSTYRGS